MRVKLILLFTFLFCLPIATSSNIYCFGGYKKTNITEYNPLTDTLNEVLENTRDIFDYSCANDFSTGKIYCFGGTFQPTQPYDINTDEITEFNPDTNTLTIKSATLPFNLTKFSCAGDSSTNKIYCFGGLYTLVWTTYRVNQTIEYDPSTDTVTIKKDLPEPRNNHACVENSLTHKIYCFGGYTPTQFSPPSDEIFEYDPSTDTFTMKSATLPSGRGVQACAEDSSTHKIYCIGGYNATRIDEIVEYDPSTDTITVKNATLNRRNHACAEGINHKIYCFGGDKSSPPYGYSDIWEYDPLTDTITNMTSTMTSIDYDLSCVRTIVIPPPPCEIVSCGAFPPDTKTNFMLLQMCHFINWVICHSFVVMICSLLLIVAYIARRFKELKK